MNLAKIPTSPEKMTKAELVKLVRDMDQRLTGLVERSLKAEELEIYFRVERLNVLMSEDFDVDGFLKRIEDAFSTSLAEVLDDTQEIYPYDFRWTEWETQFNGVWESQRARNRSRTDDD